MTEKKKLFLDRDQLLKREKLEIVQVDLGNDEVVFVRQMTGRERDTFERTIMKQVRDKKGVFTGMETVLEDFRAKLSVCTVCSKEGELIFKPGDFELLSQNMSAARLEKIVNVAQKLNAITEEDKEELVKNSGGGTAAGSSSGSAKS